MNLDKKWKPGLYVPYSVATTPLNIDQDHKEAFFPSPNFFVDKLWLKVDYVVVDGPCIREGDKVLFLSWLLKI